MQLNSRKRMLAKPSSKKRKIARQSSMKNANIPRPLKIKKPRQLNWWLIKRPHN
jgi:hypothetical protein